MSRNYSTIFILVISICLSGSLNAQRIKAEVNRTRIFIGEQILMKLTVEQGRNGMNWFNFPDSLNHIEVVSRGKIDTATAGGAITYTQVVSLTSFDSGRWQFPGLSVAGLNQITLPITIDVLPVDVSQLKDYHEIKDIEEVQPETNWLLIGLIAFITLLSIAMIYWLYVKKRKVQLVKPTLAGNLTPLQWALKELEKLKESAVSTSVETKRYYSSLNDISRKFYEMQMSQHSLHKTTDEWMLDLQPLQVDGSIKTSFFQFLRMADSVKYAKYLPPVHENQSSIDIVKQMLERVAMLHSDLYQNYQPK